MPTPSIHRSIDPHHHGVIQMFALPAVRLTQPGVPPIGTVMDIAGFLWNELCCVLAAIMFLSKSLSDFRSVFYSEVDFLSSLSEEDALLGFACGKQGSREAGKQGSREAGKRGGLRREYGSVGHCHYEEERRGPEGSRVGRMYVKQGECGGVLRKKIKFRRIIYYLI